MSIDIQRLREVASAATPGPWNTMHPRPDGRNAVERRGYNLFGDEVFQFLVVDTNPDDAEFIAAWNPETAKTVLDRLEAAEAAIERVSSEDAVRRAALEMHRDTGPRGGYGWSEYLSQARAALTAALAPVTEGGEQ